MSNKDLATLAEMLTSTEADNLKKQGITPTGGKMKCSSCGELKDLQGFTSGMICKDCSGNDNNA